MRAGTGDGDANLSRIEGAAGSSCGDLLHVPGSGSCRAQERSSLD